MNIREGVTKAQEDFDFYKNLYDHYKVRFETWAQIKRFIDEEFGDDIAEKGNELDPMFTALVDEIKYRHAEAERTFNVHDKQLDEKGRSLIHQMKIM